MEDTCNIEEKNILYGLGSKIVVEFERESIQQQSYRLLFGCSLYLTLYK